MRPLQKEIIQKLKVQPEIDPQEEFRRSVDFVKDYLSKYSFFEKCCIGDFWRSGFDVSRLYLPNSS